MTERDAMPRAIAEAFDDHSLVPTAVGASLNYDRETTTTRISERNANACTSREIAESYPRIRQTSDYISSAYSEHSRSRIKVKPRREVERINRAKSIFYIKQLIADGHDCRDPLLGMVKRSAAMFEASPRYFGMALYIQIMSERRCVSLSKINFVSRGSRGRGARRSTNGKAVVVCLLDDCDRT